MSAKRSKASKNATSAKRADAATRAGSDFKVTVQARRSSFALHPPLDFRMEYLGDDYVALVPFASGVFELQIGNAPVTRLRLPSGSVTVIEPNTRFRARPIEPVEVLAITIDAGHFRALGDVAAPNRAWHADGVIGFEDAGVHALAHEMRRSLLGDQLTQPAYLQSLADVLATRLLCHFLGEVDRRGRREALAPAVLTRIAQHIDTHLGDDIEVASLAAIANLTRAHFSRAFQSMTGDPPQRFIMKRRLCRARDLLSASSEPIAQVASRAGFSSQAHMSTLFKKELGTTPAKYRRAFAPVKA